MKPMSSTIIFLALASIAAEAGAQPPKGAGREPPVAEVVAEALRYFRVNPDAIDSLRSSSRARALLPLIAGGFRYDDDKFTRQENQTPSPLNTAEDTNRHIN